MLDLQVLLKKTMNLVVCNKRASEDDIFVLSFWCLWLFQHCICRQNI